MKKITIRDVAKAAGVSVATVSYVFNNRVDQKISEKVRKKVFQMANFLNYRPNQAAVALRNNKYKTIALVSSDNLSYLQKIDVMNFVEDFSHFIIDKDYRISHILIKNNESVANVDAVICYNIEQDTFRSLGENNTIPLIAVDSKIDDVIFYQINNNYNTIKTFSDLHFNNKEYVYITITPRHEGLKNVILSIFPNTIFVSKIEDSVIALTKYKDSNILFTNSILVNIFDTLHPTCNKNRFLYEIDNTKKFEAILQSVKDAIERTLGKEHFIEI
ncbi:MAG: LacI family DNA-binding transcriptional regulator [Bacilli bacterium]